MKKILFLLLFLFSAAGGRPALAQSKNVDSLLLLLKKNGTAPINKADTNKISLLNKLSAEYIKISSFDSALIYAEIALELSDKPGKFSTPVQLALKKERTLAYILKGTAFFRQGEFPKALDHYLKALKLSEELQDTMRIANLLGNVGNVYTMQNNLPKALDFYLKALKMDEELADESGMAKRFGGIGVVYANMGEKAKGTQADSLYAKALDYYLKALKIAEKLGNKYYLQAWLGNIGTCYHKQTINSNNPSKKEGFKNKAMEYYSRALKISEELEDKVGITTWLGNMGSLYTDIQKYAEAEIYLLKALKMSKETGGQNEESQFEEMISDLYAKTNRHQLALEHYKKAMALKDTMFNETKEKDITRREMNYEFEKKEAAAKAEQEKKEAVQQSEARRQQIITWFTIAVAIAVALFALFIFRALRITQNQKKIITEKNTHITASINYAKRIQDAILPSKEEFDSCFTDHFTFFQPREIVSGDFYWLSSMNNKTIIAVADCTGHGVPGAFMSMIGNTLLNEIVNEKQIYQPAKILDQLNEGIVQALHQESRSQDDGMDITVCLFEKDKNTITFAGANHSLYIVTDNVLEKYEGDFYAIGSMFGPKDSSGRKKDFSFSQQEIPLKKGSSVYFSTDGFADQVGGESGKKFLVKRFKELLVSSSSLSIKEQEQKIKRTFEDWKGNNAQLDDVLIVGMRI